VLVASLKTSNQKPGTGNEEHGTRKMEAIALLKKVRRIEIKTRGLTRHIFAGEYHSDFKGRAMTSRE